MDLFHSLVSLKNQLASVAFCRSTEVFNVRNGSCDRVAHWRLDKWGLIVKYSGYPVMLSIASNGK